MTSREISELVDSRHDKVKQSIERLAERGVIAQPLAGDGAKSGNGVVEKVYLLGKRDCLVVVAQLCPEFTAKIVDRWQELEEQARLPIALPKTFAEALRLAADLEEQKNQALIERDAAVASKAEIGSRREATAMQTASVATKKVSRLEIELDKSKQYATIKRMEMLYHGQSFNWRLLKSAAAEMSLPPIDVFDANYGTVKGYHADVWQEAYALPIGDAS